MDEFLIHNREQLIERCKAKVLSDRFALPLQGNCRTVSPCFWTS
jgi:hypothetical protein